MKFEENDILWDELESLVSLQELANHKEKDVYTLRLKSFTQRVISYIFSINLIVLFLRRTKISSNYDEQRNV